MRLIHLQRPSGKNMLPLRRINKTAAAHLLLGILLFCSHKSVITRYGPCSSFPGRERPQAPWPSWREVSLGEGGQVHSSGWPPGDSLPGSRPTHMCFLMGCTLRSFSECTNQVSHSTTMRVNKRLEGRLEDLGKNPFSWNPE